MKYLVFPFLFVVCTHFADAQNNAWFKGSWYGMKSFTGARIGIRVLVRIEVDSVYGNRFGGRLIYMYPKDTIGRLVKTFDGNFKDRYISLDKSKEIYLLDPRSRSFWSNCTQCNETASISLNDSDLVIRIITTNCGDSCNGETVFTRNIYNYDPSMQTKIKDFFTQDKPPVTAKINPKQKNKNIKTAKKSLADTSKNNQPVAKLNNKKTINTTGSVAKTGTSTQTIKLANKDSTAGHKTNLTETNQVNSPPVKILTDTSKTNQPLAKLNDEKRMNATDSVAQNGTSTQMIKVGNTDSLPQAIIDRATFLVNTYQVDSPHIQVDLFDNGEIDSDIVSVYYNGKLIVNHVTLTATAITFFIDASATHRYHEFILIAENEGSIPPNTALMRIKAGRQQFKVNVSTSGTRNAKIAIDYLGY